jgi:hypothetical protein
MEEDAGIVAKLRAARSARGCATMAAYEALRYASMCTSLLESPCPLQDDSGLFNAIQTKANTAAKANIGMALDAPEVEVFMLLRDRASIFESVTNWVDIHCIPPVGKSHHLDHRIDLGKDYSLDWQATARSYGQDLQARPRKRLNNTPRHFSSVCL